MSQNASKCLDYSLGGQSADSSIAKSWISIKDIKKMVNKPQAQQQTALSSTQNSTSRIKTQKSNNQSISIKRNNMKSDNTFYKPGSTVDSREDSGKSSKNILVQNKYLNNKVGSFQENNSLNMNKQNQPTADSAKQKSLQSQNSIAKFKQLEIDIENENEEEQQLIEVLQNNTDDIENQDPLQSSQQVTTYNRQDISSHSILETYDKDCEYFFEHIQKIKSQHGLPSSSDHSAQVTSKHKKGIKSQYTIPYEYNDYGQTNNTTEAVCSPKIIANSLESQETSKRNSLHRQQANHFSKKSGLTIKECNNIQLEQNMATERRGENKIIVKLQNDMALLRELLQDEKDKNSDLQQQIYFYQQQLNEIMESDKMIARINQLEEQVVSLQEELTQTKLFYEEMIQHLKDQATSLMGSVVDKHQQESKLYNISYQDEKTLQEIQESNGMNPNEYNKNAKQGKKLDQLKTLINNVSYENKSNKFLLSKKYKNNLNNNIALNDSCNLNQSSNSNILITSEYTNPSNITATLSFYDNFQQHTKFIKHFGGANKNGPKVTKQQQECAAVDDSVICEESGVNVGQIKTLNINAKKQDTQGVEEGLPKFGQGNIEDQISSLIHQIDGYLLTQSNHNQNQSMNHAPISSRRQSGCQIFQNLATFGGYQQVANSLTGTQQLSALWNNLEELNSKRMTLTNDEEDYSQSSVINDSYLMMSNRQHQQQLQQQQMNNIINNNMNIQQQQQHMHSNISHLQMLQNIEYQLQNFREKLTHNKQQYNQ